jgi:hypothetical protein
MPKPAVSGQRPARRSLYSGHPGVSNSFRKPKLSDSVPDEARRYVITTNRGDEYLRRIETGKWDAVKLHFYWTTDRTAAKEFTGAELRSSFYHVVQSFSGPKFERIF